MKSRMSEKSTVSSCALGFRFAVALGLQPLGDRRREVASQKVALALLLGDVPHQRAHAGDEVRGHRRRAAEHHD